MQRKCVSSVLSFFVCIVVLFCSILPAVALDDKYEIDELGMSLKIPKEYYVITRDSAQTDAVFSELSLDYSDTMTAFSNANIYLQAITEDKLLKITLSMTSDENSKAINNYSELTAVQRQEILDNFLSDSTYTSGVELKHSSIIFFDLALTQKNQDRTIYGYQCNTVVNGMNIDLTIQKDNEQLTADEIKIVTNIANTIDFDKIKDSNGLSFDWWRVLLWILVIVLAAVATQYLYRQYIKNNKAKQLLNRERRPLRNYSDMSDEDVILASVKDEETVTKSKDVLMSELGFDEQITEESFDELLGYKTTDYSNRASTDIEDIDINVKSKPEQSGVEYFEDSGDSIDKDDYFDSYFSTQEEKRGTVTKAISYVCMRAKQVAIHTGYFFTNLSRLISKKTGYNKKK